MNEVDQKAKINRVLFSYSIHFHSFTFICSGFALFHCFLSCSPVLADADARMFFLSFFFHSLSPHFNVFLCFGFTDLIAYMQMCILCFPCHRFHPEADAIELFKHFNSASFSLNFSSLMLKSNCGCDFVFVSKERRFKLFNSISMRISL